MTSLDWLPYPPPVAPADYSQFYVPWVRDNYTRKDEGLQKNTSILPNPESVGCLIAYAKKFWGGSKFTATNVDRVINFALANDWNPSLLLAFWLEESHAGQTSSREFGCGPAGNFPGFDRQLDCLKNHINENIKNNKFDCFLCGYAYYVDCPVGNECGWQGEGQRTHAAFPAFIQFYNYLTQGASVVNPKQYCSVASNLSSVQPAQPLRPFPNQLVEEEKKRTINDPVLAPYCAQRPTAVQTNTFDIRQPKVNVSVSGSLDSNFNWFVTPLLSLTDPRKPADEKTKRYLADYLEGRAYYEGISETKPTDVLRLGVFRKLAPETYQNQLRRAIIFRAVNKFKELAINPYGFPPATEEIHNYTVGSWLGNPVTLKDYYNNKAWAPLEDDWQVNWPGATSLTNAQTLWQRKDGGKWSSLWPYVPMFTREDSQGFISPVDEPSQATNPNPAKVIHPHLSRTYEVALSLSSLLTPIPKDGKFFPLGKPQLEEQWYTPAPWCEDVTACWWFDSGKEQAQWFQDSPLCEPQNQIVYGTGDLAKEGVLETNVSKTAYSVDNPFYSPSLKTDKCGTHPSCEKCDPITQTIVDDSNCYRYQDVRFSPTYLKTYAPFLDSIMASLITGPQAVFTTMMPYSSEEKAEDDWPAAGNLNEEIPSYSFTGGDAEAGYKQPGSVGQFFYKYLGTIHCQKEKLIASLLPFIGGSSQQLPQECLPTELALPSDQFPAGPKWLRWPHGYKAFFTSCYKERCRPYHLGIDLVGGPGSSILAAADGTVTAVRTHQVFGRYIIIKHNTSAGTWFTLYAHLQNTLVHKGQSVKAGQKIGTEGNTGQVFGVNGGYHLHFGLSRGGDISNFGSSNDKTVNPCQALPDCDCNPSNTCIWAD